jgi:hypothetical protein
MVTLILFPPVTDAGDTMTELTVTDGFTVKEDDVTVPLLYDPVTVKLVAVVTVLVGILKDWEVAPAATVTLAGATTAEFELLSEIVAPPAGAVPERPTVTLTLLPPVTELGDTATEVRLTGVESWMEIMPPVETIGVFVPLGSTARALVGVRVA